MSEQFSNSEQALIERLRRAPQPELSDEVREAILGRMLNALEYPPVRAPRPRLLHPITVIAVVVIVFALIAGGILFVLSQQNKVVPPSTPTATVEPTLSPSPTGTITLTPTASPTVSIEPTLTLIPTTAVPVVVSSPLPTEAPTSTLSLTVTESIQSTISPTLTATTGVSAIIVVEGPVQAINVNIITIYGIQIQIDPNDPLLKTIAVGDVLRVEGNNLPGTTQITIIATTVVLVNENGATEGSGNTSGNVSPPSTGSGEVWTDDGSCSHPPPDWAPANGWRRRCQGQENNNGNGNKPNKK